VCTAYSPRAHSTSAHARSRHTGIPSLCVPKVPLLLRRYARRSNSVSFDSFDVAFDFSAFAGASARCRACALVLKLFSNFLHHPRTLHSTLQCTVTFACASRSLTRRVFDAPAWELVHCLQAGLAQLSICLRSLHSLAFRSCTPKRLLLLRSLSYSNFFTFFSF